MALLSPWTLHVATCVVVRHLVVVVAETPVSYSARAWFAEQTLIEFVLRWTKDIG